jgi:hypothetical protein
MSADDIQNQAGQILSSLRLVPLKPKDQPDEPSADAVVNDAQYLARLVDLPGSVVADNPAAVWTYMRFDVCPGGRIWEVTRIGIFAADPSQVLAGVTAVAFKGVFVPQNGAVWSGGPDVIAVQGQVPNTSYPGERAAFLHPGERVIVGLKGLATSQGVVGSIAIIDRDMQHYLKQVAGL